MHNHLETLQNKVFNQYGDLLHVYHPMLQ